jgi:hypothetical protein
MYNSRHSDREGTINHFVIVNIIDKLTIRKTATHYGLINYLSIVLAVGFCFLQLLPVYWKTHGSVDRYETRLLRSRS